MSEKGVTGVTWALKALIYAGFCVTPCVTPFVTPFLFAQKGVTAFTHFAPVFFIEMVGRNFPEPA